MTIHINTDPADFEGWTTPALQQELRLTHESVRRVQCVLDTGGTTISEYGFVELPRQRRHQLRLILAGLHAKIGMLEQLLWWRAAPNAAADEVATA